MIRKLVLLLVVLVAAVFAVETTLAAVPMLISHQGRLLDASNQPVTGTRDITFHIYGDSTGGLPLWTESHLAVPIANGLFHVTLGGLVTISADLLTTTGAFDPTKWMVLSIQGTELLPRMRISSAPYAIASSRVSGDVETLPGALAVKGMSGSTTATIRASENPGDPGSELSLVDDSGNTSISILALQPLGGNVIVHSSMSGSTTGTIRMQATPDSAVSNVGLDLDGDAVLDVGTTATAVVSSGVLKNLALESRNILKSFFQTGDFPTQAQFRTQDGLSSMDLNCLEIDEEHTASVSADSTGSELKFKNGPIGGGMSGSTTATIRTGAAGGGGGAGGDASTIKVEWFDGTIQDHNVSSVMSANIIESFVNLVDDRDLLGLRSVRASADSAGSQVLLASDLDGDGHQEKNIGLYVSQVTGQASMGSATDFDDDGIPDIGVSSSTSDDRAVLQGFYERGDKPTQSQFSNLLDSDGIRSTFSSHGGSTTGTIRMAATPDSADHEISVDDILTGVSSKDNTQATKQKMWHTANFRTPTDSSKIEGTCDATGASSRLSGMSGSTTGTIRMVATADSAGNYLDQDDDGDGFSEAKITVTVRDAQGNPVAGMQVSTDTDDDGVPENEISQTVTPGTSSMALNSKALPGGGVGPRHTSIRAVADDSAMIDCSVDDDNDGTARAKGIITVKPSSGGTGGTKGKFSYDVDDDGDFDNEVDITSNGAGAGARLIGRSGSTTGTIRMAATSDSAVFVLGFSGSTTGTIRLQASESGASNPIEHSSGAHLTVGGDWTNASDKNLKENFSDVNGEELLVKIDDLSIKQWNYKNEDESITHIGPTAQDFKSAFGVGGNDKSISTVDPSGIALAAIKELNKQNQVLAKQNVELMKELKELKKKVDDLASRR